MNTQVNRTLMISAAADEGDVMTESMAGGMLLYMAMPMDIQAEVMDAARTLQMKDQELSESCSVATAVLLRTSNFQLFKELAKTGAELWHMYYTMQLH